MAGAEYANAVKELDSALLDARDLVDLIPPILEPDEENLVDTTDAFEHWETWARVPSDDALADHLISTYPEVSKAVSAVAREARELSEELEDTWRPLAQHVLEWVADARSAEEAKQAARRVQKAEKALNQVAGSLRSSRFEPIETKAKELWGELRLQSNVDLIDVELAGKGTQRRVDLKVTVDGKEGAALGVVSQGELNCLALSLFFPRVMLPESPFRFIVIDDPIQAMDPARVDGLARVFTEIAKTRQLIVFTHDDRLPQSLRRLSLPHTLHEVRRQPGSHVTVRRALDPVRQYFRDARDLILDESVTSTEVARRVVPGFCRMASRPPACRR